jgi:hypothetical protein
VCTPSHLAAAAKHIAGVTPGRFKLQVAGGWRAAGLGRGRAPAVARPPPQQE